MKTLPQAILDIMASDSIGSAFVTLLDFTTAAATHLRYARYATDITYAGNVYTAWSFEARLLGSGKSGGVPSYNLQIDDAARVLRPYLCQDWFRGATLTIPIVCVDQLAADYSNLTVTYDINRVEPAKDAITFSLGGANLTKIRFPADRYWAWQCPYARGFAVDPRCGYSGVETECSGTLTDCIARSRETSFGGFLGLDPNAEIIVIPPAQRRG